MNHLCQSNNILSKCWLVVYKHLIHTTLSLGETILLVIFEMHLHQHRNIPSFLMWGHVWRCEDHFPSFKNGNKHLLKWIPLVFYSTPVSFGPFNNTRYLLSAKMFLILYAPFELPLLGMFNRNILLYAVLYQFILLSMRVGQWYHDFLLSRLLFS